MSNATMTVQPARAKPGVLRKAAAKPAQDAAPDLPALRDRALGNQTLMRKAQPAPLTLRRKCSCGATCSKCSSDYDRIQTKLQVGDHDDAFEQEADRVALRVLGIASAPSLAPAPEPQAIQRAPAAAPGAVASQASIEPAALTHGGLPLSPGLRAFFEPRFGRDLSEVRVHGGEESEGWNDSLHAHGFTYGSHIWLGRGHAPQADFLMAHELAHVVQQRQPRMLAQAAPGREPMEAGRARPAIQRLGLSDPFWIPLGTKGKLGGRDLHDELLTIAKNNNKSLDTEAPAPNADRKDWGLGQQGSIDLYSGTALAGINWEGKPPGDQHPNPKDTWAKKHYRASMSGPQASRYKPWVKDGFIHDIDKGPTDVKLGELKPAVSTMLDEGDKQLTNYAKGMDMAANLTNEWAKRNKKTERWNLGTPTRLGAGDVKFIDGGTDLKFDPANPRDDFNLVLGTVRESFLRGGKYEHSVSFNPSKFNLPPIKGGVYAQKYTGGTEGLWMYFARPKNLDEYLKTARAALNKSHEMQLANLVQDQVINAMLKAPEKVEKKAKAGPPPLPPRIQRAPKTPNLKDDFKFSDWAKKQRDLRSQISGPTATEDTKKQVAAMELLHKAYKTDEALDKVPGTGKSKLPAKGTDLANIVTGTGKDKKTEKKELSDLGGWLKGWTSKPAEILGLFRDKFGTAFVWIANKYVSIKEWIQKKYHEHFQKKADVGGKTGKAKMILQALGRALKQVAKILVPRTLHLVMDAIEKGIKKKLAKVFDLDPEKMLDDAFGGEFTKWNQKLDDLKEKAEKYVKDTFDEYTKDMEWIKDLIDLAKDVGPIVEAAIALIQCGTPPGWGCLKLLARKLNDCAIAKVMNVCKVQKEISDLTMKIKPLKELPATLGQKIMDMLKKVSPEGLEDIFDEPVAKPSAFDSSEIECEFTPLPEGCPNWGLIPFEGGEGAPPKEGKDGKSASGGDKDDKDMKPDAGQGKPPDSGKPEPKPDSGGPQPDKGTGQPQPPPGSGGSQPKPDTGGTPPDKGTGKAPDAPAPQPDPGGTTPKGGEPPVDESRKKMEDFLEKLNKEELDELYKEAERQGLLDKPFDPKQAEDMLDQVRKKLKAQKEAEAKRKAEAAKKKKAEEEKKKKEAEAKESKGPGGTGKPGAGPGSGAGGDCVWDPSMMSVGGWLLSGGENDEVILDEGHNHTQPFSAKPILGCGGVDLKFKYDFMVSVSACEGISASPEVSLEIRFKTGTSDKELFRKSSSNPKVEGIIAEPGWGPGDRIKLGNINANGTLEIKMIMVDGSTIRTIKASIPIDVNCT